MPSAQWDPCKTTSEAAVSRVLDPPDGAALEALERGAEPRGKVLGQAQPWQLFGDQRQPLRQNLSSLDDARRHTGGRRNMAKLMPALGPPASPSDSARPVGPESIHS